MTIETIANRRYYQLPWGRNKGGRGRATRSGM